MTDRQYLVLLYSFLAFGPARTRLLISYFSKAKRIWQADTDSLIKIGLKKDLVRSFDKYRKGIDGEKYFNNLDKHSIKFITYLDKEYPKNLKDLDNAPCVLYIKGKLRTKDENAIAIVGARKMTAYGKEVTDRFSAELASLGITIISGLARGVDSQAHKAALGVGGRTIAILGCGLDLVYPPENLNLAKRIVENGALLSEYPLGYPALKSNFANRNRIISGLSKAIVVVEGEKKSGTLLTASHAAEQGRTVFAVPGAITSPLSQAPLFLIQNGARMAISSRDILEELDLQPKIEEKLSEKILPKGKEEALLTDILKNEPLHFDEIVRISHLPVSEISARLTIMEMKGLVRNIGGGIYKKT